MTDVRVSEKAAGALPLSVVIYARKNSETLRACLASVFPAAEILVAVPAGADIPQGTVAPFSARLVAVPAGADEKKAAYAVASGKWILNLHANEALTPELRGEILSLFEPDAPADAYEIFFENAVGRSVVRHGGFFPGSSVRLIRKGIVPHQTARLFAPARRLIYKDFTEAIADLDAQTDAMAVEWGRNGVRLGIPGTAAAMCSRFFKCYFKKNARLDGVTGLFLSVNEAMKIFLTYAKLWESRTAKPE